MLSFLKGSFSNFFSARSLSIVPLGARVLVELDNTTNTKVGSLYVPETAQRTPNQGIVKAVGPGHFENGKVVPLTVKVGDRVLMPQFGGQVVKYDKKEYTMIEEDAILAIFD